MPLLLAALGAGLAALLRGGGVMGQVRGREFPDVTFGAEIDGVGWVDHAWIEAGLPTCHWNGAPTGLATRRQLRELGLCPGGHEPVAALRRRPGGYLHAWLYRLDLAAEKRTATPAVLAALAEAMRPRRTCPACRRDTGCCLPRSLGECWDCHLSAPVRVAERQGGEGYRVGGGGMTGIEITTDTRPGGSNRQARTRPGRGSPIANSNEGDRNGTAPPVCECPL